MVVQTFRTDVGVGGIEAECPGEGGIIGYRLIRCREGKTHSSCPACLAHSTIGVGSKCSGGTRFTGVIKCGPGGAVVFLVTKGTLHWFNSTCQANSLMISTKKQH